MKQKIEEEKEAYIEKQKALAKLEQER